VGTNRRLSPQEATANARAWKEAFPDAKGTITAKVVDGNKGAAEIVWRGTNSGSLMGRPATGRPVTVRAALFIETNGTLVTRSAHYIDVAGMIGQLQSS
jgi:predicted ester cyclase